MSVADMLFRSFMEIVVAQGVFSDAERELASGRLSESVLKDVTSGKRLDDRRPWLMMLSGKGGYVDGPAFDSRRKFRNVEADPRVTLTIWDAENPYRYAEIRGRVDEVVRGPEAREQFDKCSYRYRGVPYPEEHIRTERAILRIDPQRIVRKGL